MRTRCGRYARSEGLEQAGPGGVLGLSALRPVETGGDLRHVGQAVRGVAAVGLLRRSQQASRNAPRQKAVAP